MSILYAISIVYIAGEYDGPPFCTPIGILKKMKKGIVIRYIWISKINKYSFSNIKRSNANTRVYVIEVLNKKKYI